MRLQAGTSQAGQGRTGVEEGVPFTSVRASRVVVNVVQHVSQVLDRQLAGLVIGG